MLSRALAILRDEHDVRTSDYVFPGGKAGKPQSNMALTDVLRRMGCSDITVYGFRSIFRDWAVERMNFQAKSSKWRSSRRSVTKVEAAYRRGDLLEKRPGLMAEWASYCNRPAVSGRGNVAPMKAPR